MTKLGKQLIKSLKSLRKQITRGEPIEVTRLERLPDGRIVRTKYMDVFPKQDPPKEPPKRYRKKKRKSSGEQ